MLKSRTVKSWMLIGLACLLAAAFQAAPAAAGLIAQWDLDEGTGTTVNASVGSINGTINGNVAWQTSGPPSVPDTSLLFGGGTGGDPLAGTDYVDFGTSTTLSPASITVGCWIRAKDADTDLTNGTILAKREKVGTNTLNSYDLAISTYTSGNYGQIFLRVYTADAPGGKVVKSYDTFTEATMRADLEWHFVVGTYDADSGYLNFYVDGEVCADPVYAGGNIISTSAPFNAGRRAWEGSPAPYKGMIGGPLFIMDEAMSAAVVKTLYNSMVPEPGTLALLTAGLIGLLAYAWRRRR